MFNMYRIYKFNLLLLGLWLVEYYPLLIVNYKIVFVNLYIINTVL